MTGWACPYLAADAALYADNDEVERLPSMWPDASVAEPDHDDAAEWLHVTEPLPRALQTLESIWGHIQRAEAAIGIDAHEVMDRCIAEFGLTPDYSRKAEILARIGPHLDDRFDQCGSPIERIMLFALLVTFATYNANDFFSADGLLWVGGVAGLGDVYLSQQHRLGQYRVDFLLATSGADRAFVIECDGHDFHERTKTQAQRDRARDRWLQTHGWTVLRFTGSEIHHDPAGCAGEIFEALPSLRGHAA